MLRNVENYSPSDTVSHPRRTEYSATLWWEPHNSQRDPHQSHPTGKKKNAPFKLQNTALCPLKNRTDEMFRGNTLKGNCMSAVLVRRTALATESGGWGSFADKEERKLSAYPLPALSSSIQWITSRRKQDKKTGWENQWVKPFKPELNLNIRNQTHWKKKKELVSITKKSLPVLFLNIAPVSCEWIERAVPLCGVIQCLWTLRPGWHWYSYLYQLLVQVTNLAFSFPRQ